MPFSQIFPPSPSPTESIRLFYTSVSTQLLKFEAGLLAYFSCLLVYFSCGFKNEM